ncbi:hypothetical protein GCM10022631_01400 [Deinococcus rubellus]|uniref:DUF1016 N-terminal domain-containing protein n=1 Tax=Deinococcus rubellus TaxID=1889240 RepID=A0ABY5YIT2_9DEIO|nr:DUF1016 N-terminal domain-containing protein [Deinococcus rubellus]UWX64720.1 DUF1016 N-terminal domain-containing protein [Deinococcus rubellus]
MTQAGGAAGEADFAPVLTLIRQAQSRALHRVNRELIGLYWQIGEHLQHKTEADGWGRGTVTVLAAWIAQEQPDSRGFSAQNLWRMRQFYETYSQHPKLSAVLRELSWTNHMTILSRSNSEQEREFYLQAAIQGRWTQRELIRQMDGSLYERALLSPAQLSPVLQAQQPAAPGIFKDSY